MIFIFDFVTCTKVTYPFMARNVFVSTCFKKTADILWCQQPMAWVDLPDFLCIPMHVMLMLTRIFHAWFPLCAQWPTQPMIHCVWCEINHFYIVRGEEHLLGEGVWNPLQRGRKGRPTLYMYHNHKLITNNVNIPFTHDSDSTG